MGQLTADITRLVGEIHTERGDRQRLIGATRQATVEMRRTLARTLGGFRAAHAEMARRQRRGLREFVSGLKSRVAALRNGLSTDLAGARGVWRGPVAAAASPTGREHSKRAGKTTGA